MNKTHEQNHKKEKKKQRRNREKKQYEQHQQHALILKMLNIFIYKHHLFYK